MSKLSGLVLSVGPDASGSINTGESILPDLSDLSERIKFVPREGQIWLDDQRAVILNLEVLITLRRELMEGLGPQKANEVLFRAGHAAGAREGMLAIKVRANKPHLDAFLVGPQLHALRGEVYVEPVILEGDVETGRYYSELLWRNSAEAETHVASFGGSNEPVCWMQIGYASGYTSTVMGRPIIFREVECVACGSSHCRIVGKPAEEWPTEPEHAFLSKVGSYSSSKDEKRSIIGRSSRFLGAWHLLTKVAPLRTTTLLLGETGVGKEIFAKAIHDASPRRKMSMLSVNCAAIPESLIDAELFGVEKGAFTGAGHARAGWFEAADKNTLFLDEIGTLNLNAQAKLLRVLQEGQFSRLGGTIMRNVDARIICATNVDLEREVKEGRFRADLLHRLNAFPIAIPPLRERRDDIPLLIDYFLSRFNERNGRHISGFTMKAVDALMAYEFPGNVRELENMIERAAILTPEDEPIDTLHLFNNQSGLHRTYLTPEVGGSLVRRAFPYLDEMPHEAISTTAGMSLMQVEQLAITEAMRVAGGNVSEAARKLGLTRAKLRHRLKLLT
ncbi:sigma 54-interacting transcriptional regulator [Rhizobium sp. KVB221]|uniref:Sigma 54-interacting transcriptional regulator n=1 Tax=Rhizobium setariae TaxID=2801340 RepID=A0A936YND7_9HYPH|nr:sigma-54-dependent Fis family transcriptional regulator [Rhizobium setariae]MBL0371897.1 sigma 54-interacting transcriptional regulator [Rhizobium setariae]